MELSFGHAVESEYYSPALQELSGLVLSVCQEGACLHITKKLQIMTSTHHDNYSLIREYFFLFSRTDLCELLAPELATESSARVGDAEDKADDMKAPTE